ncbi:MAG: TrmH family RNA methyltransferase [Candidatus Dojkabacteria bacterium]|jgi:TrmH family RNA methyltransferase
MVLPKIKRYQKKFEYSYAFGAYTVIDLLKRYPNLVYKVLLKKEGDESDGVDMVKKLCSKKNIPLEYGERQIEKIAAKENTYVVGVFKKYSSKLEEGANHLLLVNPSNMGNVGTIVRSMLGFGIRDLGIVKPAVDIFDPMVIRSTMGAIFSINFEFFNSVEEYVERYSNNLYLFMLDGKESVVDVRFEKPFTLVHGNESSGLDERYRNLGKSVYIPHSDDIDSLNLSVAVGISMWEASRD